MSVSAQITLSPEAQRYIARMEHFDDEMSTAIATTLNYENELTIGVIQADYLTGPRPARLGVRTGRLRHSIRRTNSRVTGNSVQSSIGSNVVYARSWEFGFSGPVTVRAHKRTIDQAFGVPLQSPVTVDIAEHTRHLDRTARPFIRPAINQRLPEYEASLSRAIINAATPDN